MKNRERDQLRYHGSPVRHGFVLESRFCLVTPMRDEGTRSLDREEKCGEAAGSAKEERVHVKYLSLVHIV
jgi:hypothetical protein